MKYLITILFLLSCDQISNVDCNVVQGLWKRQNVLVDLGVDYTYEVTENGHPCHSQGQYSIKGDSLIIEYKDINLNWQYNKQTIYFKLTSDSTIVLVEDVYERM